MAACLDVSGSGVIRRIPSYIDKSASPKQQVEVSETFLFITYCRCECFMTDASEGYFSQVESKI